MTKIENEIILGSLQEHCSKQKIEGGVCPTIGTTDLSLPKIIVKIEYEPNERMADNNTTD